LDTKSAKNILRWHKNGFRTAPVILNKFGHRDYGLSSILTVFLYVHRALQTMRERLTES